MIKHKKIFNEDGSFISAWEDNGSDSKKDIEESLRDRNEYIPKTCGRKFASVPYVIDLKMRNEGYDPSTMTVKDVKTWLVRNGYTDCLAVK